MTTVLLTVHIIVAILLIIVVLMQKGQEGGMGASFGGGSSQSLFGSGGSGDFLVKATGVLAATFMLTSLSLAFFSQKEASSVLDRGLNTGVVQEQPAAPAGDGAFDPTKLKDDGADIPAAE